jgi:hypothetical protein
MIAYMNGTDNSKRTAKPTPLRRKAQLETLKEFRESLRMLRALGTSYREIGTAYMDGLCGFVPLLDEEDLA